MPQTVEYSQNHFLLTFGGTQVNGREQWQCSMRFGNAAPLADPPPVTLAAAMTHISMDDIYAAVAAWFGHQGSPQRYDRYTTLEFVKVAAIGKDGKYLLDPIEKRQQLKGWLPTSTSCYPPQLAVVVSLSSGSGIGFANHGRYFLPVPWDWMPPLEPHTGQIPVAWVDEQRGMQKTMIEAIAGEISTAENPTDLCIFSPLRSTSVKVTQPSHKKVEKIGIGFAIDTQRSRRRSLPDGIVTWSPVST